MSDDQREDKPEADASEPAEAAEEQREKPVKKATKAKTKAKASDGTSESTKDRNLRIREEAAARRRANREAEQRRAAPARNLDAGEMVDDALARGSHAIGLWLKRNFTVLQWVVVIGVAAGIGYKVYSVRHERAVGEASDRLIEAVHAQHAAVGEASEGQSEPDRMSGLLDTRKHFATQEERLKAAASAYGAVTSGKLGTLASLGQAGIWYDQGKYKEAATAYESVRDSELAKSDGDVRGRAIEGVGLSQEALGNSDAALKSYRELENSGISGFAVVGAYHQARVLHAKGESQKAKELLESTLKKLAEKDKDKGRMLGAMPGYLESAARELLSVIDPKAAAALAPAGLDPELMQKLQEASGKAPGGQQMSAEKLQELMNQLSQPAAPSEPADPGTAPSSEPPPAPAPKTNEASETPAAPKPAPAAPKPAPAAPKPAPAAPKPAAPAPVAPAPAPAPAPAAPAEGSQ